MCEIAINSEMIPFCSIELNLHIIQWETQTYNCPMEWNEPLNLVLMIWLKAFDNSYT